MAGVGHRRIREIPDSGAIADDESEAPGNENEARVKSGRKMSRSSSRGSLSSLHSTNSMEDNKKPRKKPRLGGINVVVQHNPDGSTTVKAVTPTEQTSREYSEYAAVYHAPKSWSMNDIVGSAKSGGGRKYRRSSDGQKRTGSEWRNEGERGCAEGGSSSEDDVDGGVHFVRRMVRDNSLELFSLPESKAEVAGVKDEEPSKVASGIQEVPDRGDKQTPPERAEENLQPKKPFKPLIVFAGGEGRLSPEGLENETDHGSQNKQDLNKDKEETHGYNPGPSPGIQTDNWYYEAQWVSEAAQAERPVLCRSPPIVGHCGSSHRSKEKKVPLHVDVGKRRGSGNPRVQPVQSGLDNPQPFPKETLSSTPSSLPPPLAAGTSESHLVTSPDGIHIPPSAFADDLHYDLDLPCGVDIPDDLDLPALDKYGDTGPAVTPPQEYFRMIPELQGLSEATVSADDRIITAAFSMVTSTATTVTQTGQRSSPCKQIVQGPVPMDLSRQDPLSNEPEQISLGEDDSMYRKAKLKEKMKPQPSPTHTNKPPSYKQDSKLSPGLSPHGDGSACPQPHLPGERDLHHDTDESSWSATFRVSFLSCDIHACKCISYV